MLLSGKKCAEILSSKLKEQKKIGGMTVIDWSIWPRFLFYNRL
jgi:hypothetical protein